MGGFRNESNNIAFEHGLFQLIIVHLYQCSHDMAERCKVTGNQLYNHENKITDRLAANHLNLNNWGLRFIPQSPETFTPEEDVYKGRCAIKVVSKDWFRNINDYYLIECKRINGGKHLNCQYVSDGVSRFVINPVKYPSYHKRNIMFGYVVQAIDIAKNTAKIDQLQSELLVGVLSGKFLLVDNTSTEFYHYSCQYQYGIADNIELAHLFYDFSAVIKNSV
jgi:hypothetical protein